MGIVHFRGLENALQDSVEGRRGGSAWQRGLRFRDALRADAALAAAYADLKTGLALDYPGDRARYTAGKAAFIERVLATGSAATA